MDRTALENGLAGRPFETLVGGCFGPAGVTIIGLELESSVDRLERLPSRTLKPRATSGLIL